MGPVLARLMFVIVILSCLSIFSIFLIIFLSSVFVVSEISSVYNQNLRYKPIAFNIDTNNITTQTSNGNPLHLIEEALAETILINTGQSVQTAIESGNVANATGGPLGNNTYVYQSFTYYWASNSSGVTGTRINDRGVPYEVRVLYLNNKYNRISRAVKYEDGLAELVFRFNICSATSNQPFDQLSQYIRNLTTLASSLPVPVGTQFAAVENIASNFPQIDDPHSTRLNFNQYYSYPGLFIDTVTRQTFKCSTVVILKLDPQYCCITQDQFDQTFGPLKDSFGNPLSNTLAYNSSSVQTSLYTEAVIQDIYY